MIPKPLFRHPTCRICYGCLRHQFVCRSCFQDMAIKPFIAFKAECRRKIRTHEERIEKYRLDQRQQKEVRLMMDKIKRRKNIKQMEKRLRSLQNRVSDQKKQIREWQQCLQAKQHNAKTMEETLTLMSAQVSSKEEQLYERQRMLQKCQQQIAVRKNQLYNDSRLLHRLTQSSENKVNIKISTLSLPVIEQEREDVVILESVRLESPENRGNIAIFYLQQLARRMHLLSSLSKIPLPYVIRCQSFDDICIGSKRMIIYVQGKITEPPKHINLLVSCDRKRKNSVYIDESALNQLQLNYQYMMSRVGVGYEERINNSQLEQMLMKSQDFSTNLKNWQCNLNCSSLMSIQRDKAIIIHEQQIEEELRSEQFFMISNDIAFSIHTSSQQMEFIDMDDEILD